MTIDQLGETETFKQIGRALLAWYAASRRELPWRNTADPYHIWVSEVMLQQTRVSQALNYYSRFLQRFPDVQTLAGASEEEVLKLWEGMGYYGRARNLHRAARLLAEEQGGEVPRDIGAFMKLPGVGDYIGAAVQSIAFGHPVAAVDGNVKRVIARLMCVAAPVNDASSAKVFKALADKLLVIQDPGDFNQAMMELGATVCRPRRPSCAECPLEPYCQARKIHAEDRYPCRLPRRPTPLERTAVGIVHRDGRVLITKRRSEGLLGGLWEFPGGKRRPRETAAAACIREIREEVNLVVEVLAPLTRVRHAYTHFRIIMDVFHCRYVSGEVVLNGPAEHRWITLDEIDQYPFPRANHKFIPLLKDRSRHHPVAPR